MLSQLSSSTLAKVKTTSWQENCTLSASQNRDLNGLPIPFSCLMIIAQLINLLVFRRWLHKEPFLLLHLGLAVNSLLCGSVTLAHLVVRAVPSASHWNTVNVPLLRLSISVWSILRVSNMVILVFISLDRWLSVEFSLLYRQNINDRRVLGSFWLIGAVTLLIALPGKSGF